MSRSNHCAQGHISSLLPHLTSPASSHCRNWLTLKLGTTLSSSAATPSLVTVLTLAFLVFLNFEKQKQILNRCYTKLFPSKQ